jgi:hypothetical protein
MLKVLFKPSAADVFKESERSVIHAVVSKAFFSRTFVIVDTVSQEQ